MSGNAASTAINPWADTFSNLRKAPEPKPPARRQPADYRTVQQQEIPSRVTGLVRVTDERSSRNGPMLVVTVVHELEDQRQEARHYGPLYVFDAVTIGAIKASQPSSGQVGHPLELRVVQPREPKYPSSAKLP